MRIDRFACRSPLRRRNPVKKLLLSAVVLIFCLWADCPWVSASAILFMAVFNLWGNRVPFREYLRLLAAPAVFILLSGAAIAVELGFRESGWQIGVSRQSVERSLQTGLRALGAVSTMYFLALSTPAASLLAAFKRLHLPNLMVELMYLIYRCIFLLLDGAEQMRLASEARLGYRDFGTACRTFGSTMGNLLVLSLRRGRQHYHAMEARCYDGELHFFEEDDIWTDR